MSFHEEDDYKYNSFNINVWLKLKNFFIPYKKMLVGIIALMLATALIDISIPMFQRYAINNFIAYETLSGLREFIILYLTILVFQTIMVFVFARLAIIVEMRFAYDLRQALFIHLQKLSLSYYNTTQVGYILSRVLSDTNRIGSLVAWGLIEVVWDICYIVGVFVAMFILNFKLALLILLVVPPMAIITYIFQKKILKTNRELRKTNSIMTGEFNEGVTGAKTSKTLVIEDKNLQNFKKTSNKMEKTALHMARLNAVFVPIIVFFGSVTTALVLSRGGYLAVNQILEIGTLSAFLTYVLNVFEPIQQLARIFSEVVSLQANIERVTQLLEREPLIKDTEDVIKIYGDNITPIKENWEDIKGDIEFKDVTFKYPDGNEEILKNFNLYIPAGTTVAIVGETGAGKSTLVNLVCRFFEPTEGQILIDGKDYRERSQLWLHSRLGYVLQNPHLFSGTIRDNIRYGKLDATDEEIELSAKIASVDIITKKLENGYDSQVGESGDKLSTGEKQLISIARAILANPSIFVLDEATSSIDTQTEKLLQNGIEYLLKGRTSFIIAHRLSTIKKSDIILVVKEGKIIEQGNHKFLIEKKGYYYSLYTKQFEEEKTMEVLK